MAQGILTLWGEPLQELDLSRVIDVVRGDARQQREVAHLAASGHAVQVARREIRDRGAERPMGLFEQRDVRSPCLLPRQVAAVEPVGAFERKGAAACAAQTSKADVLPVRGVDDELPDAVTAWTGTPGGLPGRDTTDRTAEIRPVPCPPVVRGINDRQQLLNLTRHAYATVCCACPVS